ncbi:hypothetical protein [Roseibium sp.]|uniref:hypothetical protein n=1 Tax=Roseibium sp. TaxID=1936156 RepID=UPI003A97120A
MLNVVFSAVMVGLPAAGGAYLFVNPGGNRDVSAGVALVLYAAVLAAAFAFMLPDGKLVTGNFQLKMPGAFFAGCVIGAVIGALKRKKSEVSS